MESERNAGDEGQDEASSPDAPELRIVIHGDSPDAPQISLEQILELRKIEHQALMIKRGVEAQYISAIEAMIEERIKAKAEKAYARGGRKPSGKRKVRIEFSREFFRGEHSRIARKALEGVTYPEELDKFKLYRENLYLLYRKMQSVSCAANEMSKYLLRIKERKDLEKMRKRKAKKKQHPAEEERKSYFSEAEESRIHDYIGGIFSALEVYNSAVAEFTSSLPDWEAVERDTSFDEKKVRGANLALEQIRAAPYDESLVQVASSAAKALDEAKHCIEGIRGMIGIYLDFSHIKWRSLRFGGYLEKMGFRVTEKKYATFTRAVHAVGEIEIPEKPNPQP